jgi:pyruvate/2-oxoglutarate dehydrogenase complex dihydrolipoamide dehydrogenase (E3) component
MYDLVVIGGGAGGRSLATAGARMGARVAVIEKPSPDGSARLSPTLASKALLRAARSCHEVRQASRYGIHAGAPSIDFRAVMARVREVATRSPEFAGESCRDGAAIDVIPGTAAFEAYDTVIVDGVRRVSGRRFVIATGSRAAVPSIPGLAEAGFRDDESVWGLDALPESLVVLGGGAVGLEFAQAFARLGSSVTLLELADRILPDEDPEVSDALRAQLEAEGIVVRAGVHVAGVAIRDGRKSVTYRDRRSTAAGEAVGSELILAAGRRANIEGLNLDAIHIHAGPESGIEVDEYLQTRAPRVYAIGDVIGHHRWAHAAEREAAVVLQNALLRLSRRVDYRGVPRIVLTDPEVAAVGATEGDARREDPSVRSLRVDLAGVDRARIDGTGGGLARILVGGSGRILGAAIVGPGASATVQELILAIERGLKLGDLAASVRPYPTYGEAIRQLADRYLAETGEKGLWRGALRWLYGLGGSDRDNGTSAGSDQPAASPSGHAH